MQEISRMVHGMEQKGAILGVSRFRGISPSNEKTFVRTVPLTSRQ